MIPHATPADLDETARLVAAAGGRIVTEIVDVRDADAVQAATDRGVEPLRRPRRRLRDSGDHVARDGHSTCPRQAWQTMLDVNLTGVWRTCRADRSAPDRARLAAR